ncbi:hypothetical protein HDU82_001660, partial [Entophlyctis luteolus]
QTLWTFIAFKLNPAVVGRVWISALWFHMFARTFIRRASEYRLNEIGAALKKLTAESAVASFVFCFPNLMAAGVTALLQLANESSLAPLVEILLLPGCQLLYSIVFFKKGAQLQNIDRYLHSAKVTVPALCLPLIKILRIVDTTAGNPAIYNFLNIVSLMTTKLVVRLVTLWFWKLKKKREAKIDSASSFAIDRDSIQTSLEADVKIAIRKSSVSTVENELDESNYKEKIERNSSENVRNDAFNAITRVEGFTDKEVEFDSFSYSNSKTQIFAESFDSMHATSSSETKETSRSEKPSLAPNLGISRENSLGIPRHPSKIVHSNSLNTLSTLPSFKSDAAPDLRHKVTVHLQKAITVVNVHVTNKEWDEKEQEIIVDMERCEDALRDYLCTLIGGVFALAFFDGYTDSLSLDAVAIRIASLLVISFFMELLVIVIEVANGQEAYGVESLKTYVGFAMVFPFAMVVASSVQAQRRLTIMSNVDNLGTPALAMLIVTSVVLAVMILCCCSCFSVAAKQLAARMQHRRAQDAERKKKYAASVVSSSASSAASTSGASSSRGLLAGFSSFGRRPESSESDAGSTVYAASVRKNTPSPNGAPRGFHFSEKMRQTLASLSAGSLSSAKGDVATAVEPRDGADQSSNTIASADGSPGVVTVAISSSSREE